MYVQLKPGTIINAKIEKSLITTLIKFTGEPKENSLM